MASENEKTVFGLPGLPLESAEAPPQEKSEQASGNTAVGLSFGSDEMAQLEAAIASVEERGTGETEAAAAKPSTPRAAPLPPPRPRGATASAPAVLAPASEPPANGTVLMSAADFGDLDELLREQPTSEEPAAAPAVADTTTPAAQAGATMLFDADDVGDALSGVFGQITSGMQASRVEARLDTTSEPDEVDAAFAATEVISSDARIAALAAWEEEQKAAAAKADVRPSAPAVKAEPAPKPASSPDAKVEPAPKLESSPAAKVELPPVPAPAVAPATAAGTLLMSAEMIEQAAAAAVAAAAPPALKPAPEPPKPAPRPAAAATVMMAPDSGTPDSSSTRKAYSADELSEGKTEIPAPEKTKRYQTGAVPRVEARPAQRDSVRREPAVRQPARGDVHEQPPARRDSAALWIAGVATVLVLAAIAWFLFR